MIMFLKLSRDPKLHVRRVKALKRHIPLFTKPAIVSAVALGVWHLLRYFGIHLDKSSEVPVTAAVIPTLGITYSIIAALVLNAVWEEYRKVSVCVITDDRDTFLLYRDERIPLMIHLLLGVLSLFLIGSIMLIDYDHIWSGRCSVFSITFACVLYWVVATELDDPARSVWFKERIPQEWLEIDIDVYRAEKAKKKAV